MKNSEQYTFANEYHGGLTKREYFAGLAMQGLLSNAGHVQTFSGNNPNPVETYVAELSIKLSDELLKQLEK